jgi:twitching motility protein PilT
MQTFDQALYNHVVAGRVTLEEAIRVASSPHDFKLLLDSAGRRGTTMADVLDVPAPPDDDVAQAA